MEQIREWLDVSARHIKKWGENGTKYFEQHEIKNNKINQKCIESWNCDCKRVNFKTQ